MGICNCVNTHGMVVDYISDITNDIFEITNYTELVTLLTGNYTYSEKETSLFESTKSQIIKRATSNILKTDNILDSFKFRDPKDFSGRAKINCYDLLIFAFSITNHDDEVTDFFHLALNYGKKPNERVNKSVDRNTLKKVLKKLVYLHTEFMLNYLDPLDVRIKDDLESCKKKFKTDNINKYIEHIIGEFDKTMKQNKKISLLGDRSYFFTLEDLKLCLSNTRYNFNEKYIIVELESFVDNYLS